MFKKIVDNGMIWIIIFGLGMFYLVGLEFFSDKKSNNKIIECINSYDFEERNMLNQYCDKEEDTFECFMFIGDFYRYDDLIDSCIGRENKSKIHECIYTSKINKIYSQLNVKLDIDGSYVDKFYKDMLEIKSIARSCTN